MILTRYRNVHQCNVSNKNIIFVCLIKIPSFNLSEWLWDIFWDNLDKRHWRANIRRQWKLNEFQLYILFTCNVSPERFCWSHQARVEQLLLTSLNRNIQIILLGSRNDCFHMHRNTNIHWLGNHLWYLDLECRQNFLRWCILTWKENICSDLS